jgi:hypothetical protein
VCIATFFIVLIIRFNCIKCLVGYMLFSTTMLLSFNGRYCGLCRLVYL